MGSLLFNSGDRRQTEPITERIVLTLRELVTRYVHAPPSWLGIALVLSLSTVWLLFSLVGAQLEEDDIQEAHSAADEA